MLDDKLAADALPDDGALYISFDVDNTGTIIEVVVFTRSSLRTGLCTLVC